VHRGPGLDSTRRAQKFTNFFRFRDAIYLQANATPTVTEMITRRIFRPLSAFSPQSWTCPACVGCNDVTTRQAILTHASPEPPFAKTSNTVSNAEDYTNCPNSTITKHSRRKVCQVSSAKLDIYWDGQRTKT
jgi:hypothetical protein